jgi:hypothetical protein
VLVICYDVTDPASLEKAKAIAPGTVKVWTVNASHPLSSVGSAYQEASACNLEHRESSPQPGIHL